MTKSRKYPEVVQGDPPLRACPSCLGSDNLKTRRPVEVPVFWNPTMHRFELKDLDYADVRNQVFQYNGDDCRTICNVCGFEGSEWMFVPDLTFPNDNIWNVKAVNAAVAKFRNTKRRT